MPAPLSALSRATPLWLGEPFSRPLKGMTARVSGRYKSLLANSRRNALRTDPTRTGAIRRAMEKEIKSRFKRLERHVYDFLVTKDALGLVQQTSLLQNAVPRYREYAFLSDSQKLSAFNEWFRIQADADVLRAVSGDANIPLGSLADGPWTTKYVESAFKKGQLNAWISAHKDQLAEGTNIGEMTQEEFLRSAFGAPEMLSKVQLLGTRTWENMKGLTAAMGTQMNQILAQGMVDGRGAVWLAKEMADKIDGMTSARGLLIARTEIIHAHAEGQLQSFKDLGVTELGINAEWSTAGDDRVCPRCAALEGKVYSVKSASGLIPLHPNCRCSWIPTDKKVSKGNKEEPVGPEAGVRLADIEGHSLVSVIRQAGSQGMSYQETKALLDRAGFTAADQTIRIQLKAGRDGKGSLAPADIIERLKAGTIIAPPPPPPPPVVVPPLPDPVVIVPPPPPPPPPVLPPPLPVVVPPPPVTPPPVPPPLPPPVIPPKLPGLPAKVPPLNELTYESVLSKAKEDPHIAKLLQEVENIRTDPKFAPYPWRLRYAQGEVDQALKSRVTRIITERLNAIEGLAADTVRPAASVMKFSTFSKVTTTAKIRLEGAEEWLGKVVHPERLNAAVAHLGRRVTVKLSPKSMRAHYDPADKSVNIDKNDGANIYIHEFGHHMQNVDRRGLYRSEQEFLAKRVGTATQPTKHGDEVHFDDDFEARGGSSYAGRVYNYGKTYSGATGNIADTHEWVFGEVTTMGIQRLYEDPAGFLRQDKDYFDWVVDNIQRAP